MALALLGFFGQQVALEGFIPANLTRTGHFERLFGTGMRLHLGHDLNFGMAKVKQF